MVPVLQVSRSTFPITKLSSSQVPIILFIDSLSISPARLGPIRVVRNTVTEEGLGGLYRGLTGMWTKEIPGSFIYFGSYECARAVVIKLKETSHLGKFDAFSTTPDWSVNIV